jgi:hypothetical protein
LVYSLLTLGADNIFSTALAIIKFLLDFNPIIGFSYTFGICSLRPSYEYLNSLLANSDLGLVFKKFYGFGLADPID